jgi:hypothetical protein
MPYSAAATRKQYARVWMFDRKAAWLKANGPCRHCGSKEDLQVDHVDPSQKVTHRIWSWSLKRRQAELKKCQVLCRTCHRAKSSLEAFRPIRHGTTRGYRRGCRCVECLWAIRISRGARRSQFHERRTRSAAAPAPKTDGGLRPMETDACVRAQSSDSPLTIGAAGNTSPPRPLSLAVRA